MLISPNHDNQIDSAFKFTGGIDKGHLPPIPPRIYLLVCIVGMLITSLVGYGFYTGYRISTTYAPLIDAAMEIKLEVTAAHLGLEEVLHKDDNEDYYSVLQHVDEAMWYLRAMLEGGKNFEGTFVPVPEEELFGRVKQAQSKFVRLKSILLQRLLLASEHQSNDALDQDHDDRFQAFIKDMDLIETSLQQSMSQSLNRFRIAQAILIVACVMFAVFTGVYFRRYELYRQNNYRNLHKSYARLEKEVAKRKSAEADVRVAHDQLELRVRERTRDLGMANEHLAREVEERRKVELDLINHQARMRTLSSEWSLGEERERRRIAQSLHDSIGQNLSAISMGKLEMLRNPHCSGFDHGLDEVYGLVKQMIEETRLLIFELAPPSLYELGFVAAVEELVDKIRTQHDFKIEFHGDTTIKIDDEGVRAFVFQSIRELLSNIAQHARANISRISIRKEGQIIRIDIKDDGIGFDTDEAYAITGKNSGLGLSQIHERLQYIGGSLEIQSQVGQGTHAVLVTPIR